jgi:8-oxo-dGTP pyrophosphatase MutT (NUDIX family)
MANRHETKGDELSIKLVGGSSLHVVDEEHLSYRVDEVQFPSGLVRRYAYIDDDYGAASVVPLDKRRGRRSVLLVRQERYPSQSVGWEIVDGQSLEGESQFGAAQRELKEEGGLKAGLWQPLPQFFQIIGRGNPRSDTFLAADISPVESSPEADEVIIDRRWFTMSETEDLMLSGEINSGHTIASLALARAFLDRYPEYPISAMTAPASAK